jgi:PPM family protein phosphatase
MRLKVGAATSVGRVRPINEDAFLAKPDSGLFVVCDGMGGAAAGEVASQLAVQTVGDLLESASTGAERDEQFSARTRQLGDAVRKANLAIIERARGDAQHAGMGTTVVAMWADGGVVSVAHVGDSRAYVANAQGFAGVNADHSLVEAQVQAGLINRAESLQSEHQNILLRALGRDAEVEIDLTEITVGVGDRLLLCTDGLTRMVSDDQLAAALDRYRGNPQGACDQLIEMANNGGGPDNITVVIVEFMGSRLSGLLDVFKPQAASPKPRR